MDFYYQILDNIREKGPLVHFITNYVTSNDCANIALACGGTPIMADELRENDDILSQCSALVINIGTVNERTLDSMLYAGRIANTLGLPIIFDPAGAGSSAFRNEAIKTLLKEIDFSIIKGNISEIKSLSLNISSSKGVDASETDIVTDETVEETLQLTRKFSVLTGAIIIVTGPIDIICSSDEAYAIYNGHRTMAKVTGTGCMSAALLGCFAGANPGSLLNASVTSTLFMGICGELAYEKMVETDSGYGSYRTFLIDYAGKLREEQIKTRKQVKYFTFLETIYN